MPLNKNQVSEGVDQSVPDVGDVGGDHCATGGAGDDTAHSESGGTISVGRPRHGGALRAGHAGSLLG